MAWPSLRRLGMAALVVVPTVAHGELVGHWTFDQHGNDLTGHFGNTQFFSGATLENGALVVSAELGSWAKAASYSGPEINEKTLIAWLTLDELDVRGGAALTLERDSDNVFENRFDGIVYGEIESRKWMAGSEFYNRTQAVPQDGERESATETVVMAIRYRSDNTISVFRNGNLYSEYSKGQLQSFGDEPTAAVFGKRHTWPGLAMPYLSARIDEARIYNEALSDQFMETLTPVPEPMTGLGLLASLFAFRRRKAD
ncbi:MAG TPA: PEP-CTERM sorting domain-containing protein [Fimbriimonadaceae bacterium]|nr:PEP-CTERM sorting domain-containing protein [Fimbriimonadaceae bacterium]